VNGLSDQQLLLDYTESKSESAFAELVRRHIALVYSAALRMVRDTHLAQDVTQGVFLALAKNSQQLANHAVLSGWMHRTSRNIAAQTVRTDVRRRAREQEAAAMDELLPANPDPLWENVAPHLDNAVGDLNEADREALLLRYFERKSAAEIGQIFGISNEAAQKRVSRAVERLRESLAQRGVTVGATALVALIGANAVHAVPAGLALAMSAAVAGTTFTTVATLTAAKTIAMTTLQKSIITLAPRLRHRHGRLPSAPSLHFTKPRSYPRTATRAARRAAD
jgi:RNA polymerase sigma factor (sigma-70 family)